MQDSRQRQVAKGRFQTYSRADKGSQGTGNDGAGGSHVWKAGMNAHLFDDLEKQINPSSGNVTE
jgi:hypothetical protein